MKFVGTWKVATPSANSANSRGSIQVVKLFCPTVLSSSCFKAPHSSCVMCPRFWCRSAVRLWAREPCISAFPRVSRRNGTLLAPNPTRQKQAKYAPPGTPSRKWLLFSARTAQIIRTDRKPKLLRPKMAAPQGQVLRLYPSTARRPSQFGVCPPKRDVNRMIEISNWETVQATDLRT